MRKHGRQRRSTRFPEQKGEASQGLLNENHYNRCFNLRHGESCSLACGLQIVVNHHDLLILASKLFNVSMRVALNLFSHVLRASGVQGWHPGNQRNQERVWKKEQEALAEKKQVEELRKQYEEARQKEEMEKIAIAAGVKKYFPPSLTLVSFPRI